MRSVRNSLKAPALSIPTIGPEPVLDETTAVTVCVHVAILTVIAVSQTSEVRLLAVVGAGRIRISGPKQRCEQKE